MDGLDQLVNCLECKHIKYGIDKKYNILSFDYGIDKIRVLTNKETFNNIEVWRVLINNDSISSQTLFSNVYFYNDSIMFDCKGLFLETRIYN